MTEIKSKKHYHRTDPQELLREAIFPHQKTSRKTIFTVKLSIVTIFNKSISRES